MVRSRRNKPAKLEPEPKPKPKPETETEILPPLFPTPLPKPKQPSPNNQAIQIMKRVWSKFDVIVIMRGVVDYIVEMGVDPMKNLDDFVEFVNKKSSSSSYNGYDCGKITWKLGENGGDDEKNCTLHLETRNFDVLGKNNEKGCVIGDKVLNLGKNDCGVSCLSDSESVNMKGSFVIGGMVFNLGMNDGGGVKQKGSFVENVSNSGKNDNWVTDMKKNSSVDENMSNSGKNDGFFSCASSPSSGRKNSSAVENELNLGKNDGGVSCVSNPSSGTKKNRVVENDLNSGKNDGGSCGNSSSRRRWRRRNMSSVVVNMSNSGKNDGGGVNCVSSPSSGRKKSSVHENGSNSGKNDGGVSSPSTPNGVKKSNICENQLDSRKNNGSVSSSSSPKSVNRSDVREKKSNSRENDGGVSCLTNLSTVKKSGVWGKKGNFKENVGGNKCLSNRKDVEKSKLVADYGGVYCAETRKDRRRRRNRVGANRWTFGGRIRKTARGVVVGKRSILRGKEDGGNKQNNSNKKACADSVIQFKKGGVKNNNGGCANLTDFGGWDKNEVTLREAVRRMISRRLSLRDELETDLLWCPPRIGVLKWNTDASVREDDNKAAIGGVLRDWNGSFRCVFSCPLDCCESNEAEVKAIYKALELASCKDWLLSLHMVIESDSMNAVRWCNEDNGGPLNLGYMLNFIRECRRWWPGLEIVYMGRKSNSVADRLSKQGHGRNADFVAWM